MLSRAKKLPNNRDQGLVFMEAKKLTEVNNFSR